jgi:hypothetical protein
LSSSWQRPFDIEVMAFDPMILSFFGLQRCKFTRLMDSSVQAVSAIIASNHGLQSKVISNSEPAVPQF